MTTTQEKQSFKPALESMLSTLGHHENQDVVLSKELAISLINLRGGDKFYNVQYKNIAETAYDPKHDMSKADQCSVFESYKAEIEVLVRALFSKSATTSFITYIQNESNGALTLDETAQGLYECQICNEEPSRERLLVQNVMIHKSLNQLSKSYIWHIENSATGKLDENTVVNTGYKKYKIERIYVVNESNVFNRIDFKDSLRKTVGLLIDGGIHWITTHFISTDEIADALSFADIEIMSNGHWGIKDSNSSYTLFDKKINRVDKPYNSVFLPSSFYVKKAALKSNGGQFWTLDEVKNTYFTR